MFTLRTVTQLVLQAKKKKVLHVLVIPVVCTPLVRPWTEKLIAPADVSADGSAGVSPGSTTVITIDRHRRVICNGFSSFNRHGEHRFRRQASRLRRGAVLVSVRLGLFVVGGMLVGCVPFLAVDFFKGMCTPIDETLHNSLFSCSSDRNHWVQRNRLIQGQRKGGGERTPD